MAESKYKISIEGNVGTWEMFNTQGDVNGTYTGTFKFRCMLTPTQKIAAGREMRDILGPQMLLASENDSNVAFALTQLKYRIISAPPFWKTGGAYDGDILDSNIIMEVLDASIDAEVAYLDSLKQKKIDAIKRAKAAAEKLVNGQEEEAEDEDEQD